MGRGRGEEGPGFISDVTNLPTKSKMADGKHTQFNNMLIFLYWNKLDTDICTKFGQASTSNS